jgi:signal transduction histidine kinase
LQAKSLLFKHQAIDLLLAIDSDVSQFILRSATKTDYCQLDSECFKIHKEGSIQLTIKEIASDDDATIKFSVKDTGMGIKQNQEKIFHSLCKKIFLLLENLVEQV